jgi:hypothetical protein
MSTNVKNHKDQDDRQKGMLSNQPRLMRITPTVLLGRREQQPTEGMTSLGTDFEMLAYRQGYSEEHLWPVNAVAHLFGDGDLDAGHDCKVKASAAKEFVEMKKPQGDHELSQAQKHQLEVIVMTNKLDKPQVEAKAMVSRAHELTHTIPPGQAQGTYWGRIKCKEHFGNPREAVKRQATINPDSQIWKSLEDSLSKIYCVDLAEAYVMPGEYKLKACVEKMLRAEAKEGHVGRLICQVTLDACVQPRSRINTTLFTRKL